MRKTEMDKITILIYLFTISFISIYYFFRMVSYIGWNQPSYLLVGELLLVFFFLYKRFYWKLKKFHSLGYVVNIIIYVVVLGFLIVGVNGNSLFILMISCLLIMLVEYSRLYLAAKIDTITQKVQQFEDSQKNINETFRVVRSERHDFLKHVTAIHFMMENKQFEEAKSYMDNIVETYEETNLSIKGEEGVVAGLLHRTYQQAKELGVQVHYSFDLPLSTLPLKSDELVGLLGNTLSNAMEACIQWKQAGREEAYLSIEFYKRSGLYILVCRNSTLPQSIDILDSLFEKYGVSSKEGKHEGLGTKIISDIVKKNNGFLDFVCKDEQFTLKFKFPAIQ